MSKATYPKRLNIPVTESQFLKFRSYCFKLGLDMSTVVRRLVSEAVSPKKGGGK